MGAVLNTRSLSCTQTPTCLRERDSRRPRGTSRTSTHCTRGARSREVTACWWRLAVSASGRTAPARQGKLEFIFMLLLGRDMAL